MLCVQGAIKGLGLFKSAELLSSTGITGSEQVTYPKILGIFLIQKNTQLLLKISVQSNSVKPTLPSLGCNMLIH